MISLVLRFFGYAKVPPEVSRLANGLRFMWLHDPEDPRIGEGLNVLAEFLRSAREAA